MSNWDNVLGYGEQTPTYNSEASKLFWNNIMKSADGPMTYGKPTDTSKLDLNISKDTDWGGLGLGLANTLMGYKNYELNKEIAKDKLKTSKMNREFAASQLANQAGTQKSLAGAFGANTDVYDKKLSLADKYGG